MLIVGSGNIVHNLRASRRGAAAPDEVPLFFNTGFQAASISMRSVLWG